MRQIKFRIWDKSAKRFIYSQDILADQYFSISMCGKVRSILGNEDEFVIQQWTGMTDTNDREIYEGDFFKSGEYQWDFVKFIDGKFMANLRGARLFDLSELDSIVIGNNFQNPELLPN